MLRLTKAAIFTASCLIAGSALAQSAGDPIAVRQELMKANGAAMKAAAPMVKGETEYNPVVAELAMRTLQSVGLTFPLFFPEDSKTGGDTEAAPAIWENKAEFEATAAKLASDAAAAAEAAKGGLDSFKAAFATAAGNCKGCHDDFRIKKN